MAVVAFQRRLDPGLSAQNCWIGMHLPFGVGHSVWRERILATDHRPRIVPLHAAFGNQSYAGRSVALAFLVEFYEFR